MVVSSDKNIRSNVMTRQTLNHDEPNSNAIGAKLWFVKIYYLQVNTLDGRRRQFFFKWHFLNSSWTEKRKHTKMDTFFDKLSSFFTSYGLSFVILHNEHIQEPYHIYFWPLVNFTEILVKQIHIRKMRIIRQCFLCISLNIFHSIN